MRLRAVLIDDEPQSVELLAGYLERNPDLVEIVGQAFTSEKGVDTIRKQQPDVVFLDVQMPGQSGIELLEQCHPRDFEVVIVSAHERFAFQAYQQQVFHYLLKPFTPQDVKATLQRIIGARQGRMAKDRLSEMALEKNQAGKEAGRVSISTLEGVHIIKISDILWCEADGSYTRIFLKNNQRIIASQSIRHFDQLLSVHRFMRVHKSHLVNLNEVEFIDHNGGLKLRHCETRIQVATRKRQELLQKLTGS